MVFGQGTMEEAKRYRNQKEYDKAVRIFQTLADKGEVEAKYYLALCYANGQGVSQDYSEAVYWHEKAANQGYAPARNNLAFCYEKAKGVPQDYSKAVYWYKKSGRPRSRIGIIWFRFLLCKWSRCIVRLFQGCLLV